MPHPPHQGCSTQHAMAPSWVLFLDPGVVNHGVALCEFDEGGKLARVHHLEHVVTTVDKGRPGYTRRVAEALMVELVRIVADKPSPYIFIEDCVHVSNKALQWVIKYLFDDELPKLGWTVRFMKPKQKVPDIAGNSAQRKVAMTEAAEAWLAQTDPDLLQTWSDDERLHDMADVIAMARYLDANPDVEYTTKPDARARYAVAGAKRRRSA